MGVSLSKWMSSIFNWFQPHQAENSRPFSIQNSSEQQTVYSWDKRNADLKIDASEFRLQNLSDIQVHRSPASQSQQLTIANCCRSLITVTACLDSVFIDDSSSCKIILGPVRGSVFLRNCNHCLVVTMCGQLRVRDCRELNLFLHCSSQPSIESSASVFFNCMSLNYPRLKEHMQLAELDETTNLWSKIFDFSSSPVDGMAKNWIIMEIDERVENLLSESDILHCSKNDIDFDRISSIVPFTHPSLKIGEHPLQGYLIPDITESFHNLVDI